MRPADTSGAGSRRQGRHAWEDKGDASKLVIEGVQTTHAKREFYCFRCGSTFWSMRVEDRETNTVRETLPPEIGCRDTFPLDDRHQHNMFY